MQDFKRITITHNFDEFNEASHTYSVNNPSTKSYAQHNLLQCNKLIIFTMNFHFCPLNPPHWTSKGSDLSVWFDVTCIAYASMFTCRVMRNVTISSTTGTLWTVKRCTVPNKYFISTVPSLLGDTSGCSSSDGDSASQRSPPTRSSHSDKP